MLTDQLLLVSGLHSDQMEVTPCCSYNKLTDELRLRLQ
jgi:hypothetical protein